MYHINGDAELTNLELTARLLEPAARAGTWWCTVADRKGHDRRYSLDDSLLRGWATRPRIPFDEGLRPPSRWYRENRAWWEPLKQGCPDAPEPAGAGAACAR